MCGICGKFNWNGNPVNTSVLNSMVKSLEKRGPDDFGSWIDKDYNVGLGHRRLSIIDLTQAAHQPMIYGNLSLVFNGCIYNYNALREQLINLGHSFNSHSDTEVILKAYSQWGTDSPKHFEGMFAYALWDGDKRQLYLVRDRFGIKPLYLSVQQGSIKFASNTQSLLTTPNIDKNINPIALHYALTLHGVVPAPHTILKGINKLEPGHYMTIDTKGNINKKSYWSLKAQRPQNASNITDKDWLNTIHSSLKNAVHKRLLASDVPVGVLLSGGLDSSLIVALLAKAGVKDIHTFSIGFEDQPEEKGSEFEYSDLIVSRYKTIHKKYLIANTQILPRLTEAVDAMSEPMFAQDAIAFYLLSEKVSQQIKVVMSGQGADEVFAGYFWYDKMAKAQAKAVQNSQAVDSFAPHYFDREHSEWLNMVHPQYHVDDVTSDWINEQLQLPNADTFIDQVLRLDTTSLIVDDPVKRVDNMTMAWGLEARMPFLDHSLVETVMSAPANLKLKEPKHLLKEISRGIVPDEIIDRPKGYFPMPALKYVRGDFLKFMTDTLTSDVAKNRNLFNQCYINALLKNPDSTKNFTPINANKLWQATLLELWLQRHID